MSDENAPLRDVLWKMYQEHCTQGRHHETQRSTVVSAIIAVSAATIGIITFDRSIAAPIDVPLSVILIVLGLFGAGFSMKHYERFSLHMERARRHRDALDALLPGQPLATLKADADRAHALKFSRLEKRRLHHWWSILNLAVAFIGACLLVIAVWFPVPALSEQRTEQAGTNRHTVTSTPSVQR